MRGLKLLSSSLKLTLPVSGMLHAEYQSINGLIKSSWKKKGNQLVQQVTIPVNTKATVFVKGDKEKISLSEKNRKYTRHPPAVEMLTDTRGWKLAPVAMNLL